jgi:predicted phosphodiesterase
MVDRGAVARAARCALLAASLLAVAMSAAATTITRGPYLQLLTTHSVTVVWNTDTPAVCGLFIGAVGSSATTIPGGTGTTCAIAVDGLVPGGSYVYVPLADDAPLDSEAVFRADDASRPFTLLVLGDSGTGDAAQLAVRDRMLASAADLVLHTGDMIYEDGAADDFDPKFFGPYQELLRRLVVWPCLGNHDVHTLGGGGQPWREAFYTPANNPAGSENYYSFDVGNAHVVVLDSNDSTAPGSAQSIFLEQDLAASVATWKFVAFHHTIYSSSPRHGSDLGIRANLVPIFDRQQVDVVFMGHEHDYERTWPLRADRVVAPGAGTVYVTTGGGGKALYVAGMSSFTAYAESTFHFTQVAVDGETLLLEMIRADGSVGDSMTLVKGSASTTTPTTVSVESSTEPPTSTTSTTITTSSTTSTTSLPPTVFIIMMENHDWSSIKDSPDAPYINQTLLPAYAHAENYRTGGIYPSFPNYIALEAGDEFGLLGLSPLPTDFRIATTDHLTTYLANAGLSWRSYSEMLPGGGTVCPLTEASFYSLDHNAYAYFDDVTGNPPRADDAYCMQHIRPYEEFAPDLQNDTVARYNFIVPDDLDQGEKHTVVGSSLVAQSDAWLASEVPRILASPAYQRDGVLLIVWDEAKTHGVDNPIGCIVVSPLAKPGYSNTIPYSHASTLRTVQEILGVGPLLRKAAVATDLSDLFTTFPAAGAAGITTTTAPPTTSTTAPQTTTTSSSTSTTTVLPALAFNAVADTYVDAKAATKNFGSSKTMSADGSPVRIVYLRFTVTGVGSRLVTQAVLRLTVDSASSAASASGGSVHRISDGSWQERTVTYGTRPAVDGAALATQGRVKAKQAVSFDITPAVHGDGSYDLALETTSTDDVRYRTREAKTGRPQLLLTVMSESTETSSTSTSSSTSTTEATTTSTTETTSTTL